MALDFIGDVAQAASAVWLQLDRKGQATQLEIARANQAAAEAAANMTPKKAETPWLLYGGITLAVIIILFLLFKKSA